MSDEDRYIPGVPCWIDTNQPDPEAAVAFYSDLFGWEFEDVDASRSRRAGTSSPGCAAARSRRSARDAGGRAAGWRPGTRTCWVGGR